MIRTITPLAVLGGCKVGSGTHSGGGRRRRRRKKRGPSLLLSLGKTRTGRESLMSLPYPFSHAEEDSDGAGKHRRKKEEEETLNGEGKKI